MRTPIGDRTGEPGSEEPTALVAIAVRGMAKEVRLLVAERDVLRSENEALRVERQDLLAALMAISRRLGRRTVATLPATAWMARTGEEPARLQLDRASLSVSYEHREVRLAPREYELLAYMLDHRGQALTRATLLQAMFPTASGEDARTLRVRVQAVRAKLRRLGSPPVQIGTLHGIGYRLEHRDA